MTHITHRFISSAQKSIRAGVRQFIDHPQLWFTIVVAFTIVVSFLFMANRFISIAENAQEQLIQTRVGSLQDAFATLAPEIYDTPEILREYIGRIVALNPTIVNFYIVEKKSTGWEVALAQDSKMEGTRILGQDFILSLAVTDPNHSFTIEEVRSAGRFFRTVRGVVDRDGALIGVVMTRQSMSEADRAIGESIRGGMIILVLILLLILLLFFRHARIIDYTVLYRKLKEIDQMKDDFVSMASHELRTPLSAIRGYIDILKDAKGKDNQVEYMRRIDVSAQELAQLVDDILDVSKIEQGRIEMNLVQINPTEIITTAFSSLNIKAEQKKLEYIHKSLVAEDVMLLIDATRFKQVLINLIGNAIKYTPEGSVTVINEVKDGQFVIRVSDTGLGMTEDERKHLFEKFWRASGQDVRSQTGTGLGLWITKQFVEAMHGVLSVESIKGVGSHFILKFPLDKSSLE